MKSFFLLLIAITFSLSAVAQSVNQNKKNKGFNVVFVNKEAERKVDVMIDGKLFTSYCWYENVFKPVLYPICTSSGTEITRGFPLKQRAGERTDHPHQIGMWLTYGNVDQNDFWGNGSQGLGKRNANGVGIGL